MFDLGRDSFGGKEGRPAVIVDVRGPGRMRERDPRADLWDHTGM
jgi:hypothetical protein